MSDSFDEFWFQFLQNSVEFVIIFKFSFAHDVLLLVDVDCSKRLPKQFVPFAIDQTEAILPIKLINYYDN